jgi:hypothetical protein
VNAAAPRPAPVGPGEATASPDAVRRPRTPAGLFLRATATNHRAEAVPDDAARGVFARAFALAVGLRFRPDTPLTVIAGSVAGAARRHTQLTVPVREAEMLIREALGETVPTAGIDPAQRMVVHVLIFTAVVEELALTDDELDELIADAETSGAGEPEP